MVILYFTMVSHGQRVADMSQAYLEEYDDMM